MVISVTYLGSKILTMHRRVSLTAIAKDSGVSVSTVSRYIKGELTVLPQTREAIENSIKKLDYERSPAASFLHERILNIFIPDLSNPFFSEVVDKFSHFGKTIDVTVQVIPTGDNCESQTRTLEKVNFNPFWAVIFFGLNSQVTLDKNKLAQVENRALVMDEHIDQPWASKLPFIGSDNYSGAYLATKSLLKLGHQQIAFIGGPKSISSTKGRYKGFTDAFNDVSLSVDPKLLFFGTHRPETGENAMSYICQLNPRPTAVFACSDVIAFGALNAASTLGIHVPTDLSLIGFDGIQVRKLIRPQLSTVRQPVSEMVQASLKVLTESHESFVKPMKLPMTLIAGDTLSKASNN